MGVSVIMPCHNAAPYIRDAIESVCAQTTTPEELIIIDDRSDDDSVQIAKSIVTSFQMVYLRVDAGNAAAARNAGINVAKGEWLAFLDVDDVWYANHLATALSVLSLGTDVAYRSLFDLLSLSDERAQLNGPRPLDRVATGLSINDFFRLAWQGLPNSPGTYLVRRERALAIGGFDAELRRRHDLDFWIRAINGKSWCFSPAVGMGYRVATPGSISKNIAERNWYELLVWLKAEELNPDDDCLKRLIRGSADRVLRTALTEGSGSDLKIARKTAYPRASALSRTGFVLLSRAPWIVRTAKRVLGRSA